jgi:mevalonate kinase
MSARSAYATGKIILSGEYAMVFGKPGIAFPSTHWIGVTHKRDRKRGLEVAWPDAPELWKAYLKEIAKRCGNPAGTLSVENYIPLGKGMGSSTALLIAACKLLLGDDCREQALKMENEVNPGNSGMDFAVIWEHQPVYYSKSRGAVPIGMPGEIIDGAILVDTGAPNEATPELVQWVRSREKEPAVAEAIESIGKCTERLAKGDGVREVIREHHRAQAALGVVPPHVAGFIEAIEKLGGAAKVIGAGGRTGGGGMVLALHDKPAEIHKLIEPEPDYVLPKKD